MKSNKYKKVANCIPVKGSNRSVICDLQRNTFDFIPNEVFDILELHDGKTLKHIQAYYKNEYDKIIEDYFTFLLSKEYVFLTSNPSLYPKLCLKWQEPFEINNAIIDFDESCQYANVLSQLNDLKCKFIEIRFFKKISFKIIIDILNYLNHTKSITYSVGFVVPYSNQTSVKKLQSIIADNPRVSYFIISNSTNSSFIEPVNNKMGYIYFAKEKVESILSCGLISKNFTVNTKLFTESQHHNTCLNRKISIDKNGDIRNCPSMSQSFGNIKDTTLEQALAHPDFKKYWNITKDQISVCKDCEFRHICTDCRAYTERNHFEEDIDLSKPLKCGYNPYTNVWEEWSTNPLKQKAIEYYGMQDLIKKDA